MKTSEAAGFKTRSSLTSASFIGLLTTAAAAGAAPPGCGAANNSVCLDAPAIGGSYCLRDGSHDGLAIRIASVPDIWPVQSKHTVDLSIKSGDPTICPLPQSTGKVPLADGDRLSIVDDLAGNFDVDVLQFANNYQSYFAKPLKVKKPIGASSYLAVNTGASGPYANYDIFILFADDGMGKPKSVSVSRIEKFYHVEIFPSGTNPQTCAMERPDVTTPIFGIPPNVSYVSVNLKEAKTQNDLGVCVPKPLPPGLVRGLEVVTGGGAEHPPG